MIAPLALVRQGVSGVLGATFLGNSLEAWLTALGVSLAALLGLVLLRRLLGRRLAELATKTETSLDDYVSEAVAATKFFFLGSSSLFFGAQVLRTSASATRWIGTVAVLCLLIQSGLWVDALMRLWLKRYQARVEEDPRRVTTVKATAFVVRAVLFTVIVLLGLDNIPGVRITALITSLGIGGVAVALASQSILGDLFASLVISLDQPFVIGDFIVVDDQMGTVEHVGLKTTRVRSLGGEQIIFSNSDLLKSRIRNYKLMKERRILFSVGVTYQTPAEKLREIPRMLQEIIGALHHARFERAHFKEFGDSALGFEVVYWVEVPEYAVYMDIQQSINLALFERFTRESIEFAYPTQTVFVAPQGASEA